MASVEELEVLELHHQVDVGALLATTEAFPAVVLRPELQRWGLIRMERTQAFLLPVDLQSEIFGNAQDADRLQLIDAELIYARHGKGVSSFRVSSFKFQGPP